MTREELKELIRLANDFSKFYNETGFINIYYDVAKDRPMVLMATEEFFQTFGTDHEFGREEGNYDKYYRHHIEDGVLFYTLMSGTELEKCELMEKVEEDRE